MKNLIFTGLDKDLRGQIVATQDNETVVYDIHFNTMFEIFAAEPKAPFFDLNMVTAKNLDDLIGSIPDFQPNNYS